MEETYGKTARSILEEYPLAVAYEWTSPSNCGARSLEWHLSHDAPAQRSMFDMELTMFQRERRLFHKTRAERGNGRVADSEARRSGQAQNGRAVGGDARI